MKASFRSIRAPGRDVLGSKYLMLILVLVLLFVMGPTVHHSKSSYYVADAFAAAKKKPNKANNKKNNSQASTNRGFGAPPPTLLEVLEEMDQKTKSKQLRPNVYDEDGSITSFQDRPCPCGGLSPSSTASSSSIPYKDCCQPLHDTALGTKYVESPSCLSPLDVLRSRYTAFVMRNAGYIISTTHPECRDYREDKVSWAKSFDKEGLFDSFEFIKLEVLGDDDDEKDDESNSNENEAYISFQVTLQKKDKVDERTIVKERSRFLKDPMKGSWTYAGGDVRSQVEGLQDTQLNQ